MTTIATPSHRSARRRRAASLLMTAALLSACGSGGGGDATPPPPPPPPPASAVLTGTAAAGSAVANATVSVSNSQGSSPCIEAVLTTSVLGTYTCTLKAAEVAPFFVVVNDPAGGAAPLVSALASTPAAGATVVLNATPLTTAVLAQLASDGNALTLVAGRALSAVTLQQISDNVVAQLANVLATLGAPAGYNPFSTPITAASAGTAGNTADQLLDVVRVVTDTATGGLALATPDNPTPVALATATSAGAVLAAPAAGVTALVQANPAQASALTACFALPVAQRVLASDTTVALSQGGPAVTSLAAACQNIAGSTSNAAAIDFLHNGYSFGQFFYSLLTADTMTGASFSVPEVVAFYPAATSDSGSDEAVLNFKYLDANGNPGNVITVVRNIAGATATGHASTWWLTGNRLTVDVNVKPLIRRLEQFNPASANVSRYQSGIQFLVNAKGPGSVGAAGAMAYARISGPGLPAGGLVMSAPSTAEIGQTSMDVLNKTGTVAGSTQCFNCPNYWFSQTAGLTGTAATTLAANPNSLTWAPTGVDISQAVKGQAYQVELFYGGSTVAGLVVNKALLSNLVPSTQGSRLAWSALGPNGLAALDPGNSSLNGVLSTLTVDWVQNAAAEQISSINLSSANGGFSAGIPVPKGVNSIVLTPALPVPALTTGTSRVLLLHYRTLDNTDKNSYFTYN